MTDEYRIEQVTRVPVPQWGRDTEGTWIREWEVYLAEPLGERGLGDPSELSQGGVEVRLEVKEDQRTIRVITRTRLDPFSDEIFFAAAYRMLKRIDDSIGRIELVQGQPREIWQPFRGST